MLEPEEALWLCERGSLEMLFGSGMANGSREVDSCVGERGDGVEELVSLDGVPMSLQAMYACCIGSRGLTLERYIVYAGLKRAGYAVFRAKGGWDDDDNDEEEEESGKTIDPEAEGGVSLQNWFQRLLGNLVTSLSPRPSLPLIGNSFFRDYSKHQSTITQPLPSNLHTDL